MYLPASYENGTCDVCEKKNIKISLIYLGVFNFEYICDECLNNRINLMIEVKKNIK